jgi:DNA-binding response OmpR family regulator
MPGTESDTLTLDSPAIDPSEMLSTKRSEISKPERSPEILLISPAREDHETLGRILCDLHPIGGAASCREAVAFLCRYRVPVIFCERDLPDGTWRDILSYTAELTNPPALIVTSRLADEYLWAEALNMGAYDVLAKPFHEREVRYALTGALRLTTSPAPRVLTAGASGFE